MQITFGSKLKSILARKLQREERGQTNQMEINTGGHGDLFYRCSVPKNLIPGHKGWVYFNPFPLSNNHLDLVSLLLNQTGH
jgi:hypothetical protein